MTALVLAVYASAQPAAPTYTLDQITVLDGIGGYAYLTQISSRIPTTAQAQYFIEKVRELHLLRELIKVSTGVVENCFNYQGGLEEFIDKVELDIFQITQDRISDSAKPMKEPTREAMNVITK